jgi:hypothetical protein
MRMARSQAPEHHVKFPLNNCAAGQGNLLAAFLFFGRKAKSSPQRPLRSTEGAEMGAAFSVLTLKSVRRHVWRKAKNSPRRPLRSAEEAGTNVSEVG